MEAVEGHFILPAGFQAWDGDRALLSLDRHCSGLPLGILVLDHEGGEAAPGHSPGQAQGVGGGTSHCQLPQQWLLRGLGAGILAPLWGCKLQAQPGLKGQPEVTPGGSDWVSGSADLLAHLVSQGLTYHLGLGSSGGLDQPSRAGESGSPPPGRGQGLEPAFSGRPSQCLAEGKCVEGELGGVAWVYVLPLTGGALS